MMDEKVQLMIQGLLARENIRHFHVKGVDEEHYDMLGLHREECRNFLQEGWEHSTSLPRRT
jgi:hypothetical protein